MHVLESLPIPHSAFHRVEYTKGSCYCAFAWSNVATSTVNIDFRAIPSYLGGRGRLGLLRAHISGTDIWTPSLHTLPASMSLSDYPQAVVPCRLQARSIAGDIGQSPYTSMQRSIPAANQYFLVDSRNLYRLVM